MIPPVPDRMGRVGVFSPGIARIPDLAAFVGAEEIVFRPDLRRAEVDAVVGWGRKPNSVTAYRWARRTGVPYYFLEDGFLRSVRPGVTGEPPLSIVVDDLGMYYDATRPCRLERLLLAQGTEDPLGDADLLARARWCIERITSAGLSKYNHQPDVDLGEATRPRVLVVDQTSGDMSIRHGCVRTGGFPAMVEAALNENPDAEVLVKTHPDVLLGAKTGHLGPLHARDRLRLLSAPARPSSLIEQVDRVYVATSLMGFEALLVGRPVTCFGAPFYAGWGLTDDRVTLTRRRGHPRTLEQLFAASHLIYARYVDPETGERCEAERVVEHLALQRKYGDANEGKLYVVGMSAWKRSFVPAFLQSPRNEVKHVSRLPSSARLRAERDARLVVWGVADVPVVEVDTPVWRMEDGFLRSIGLGSDLYRPASLVVDRQGIYYDPTHESELERILATGNFEEEELRRARSLRERIVSSGISKYNVGTKQRVGPPAGDARPVVLVVGQVEDDAAVRLGCPGIRRNEELLEQVREHRPEGFVVFKPHPDVVSGNRKGAVPETRARILSDQIVYDATLQSCLSVADEVHVMSSFVGFEALLRGIPVFTHGQPFYSGWGMTQDALPHPRRTRQLSIDELVAGTLIRYPRYIGPRSGAFTTPEVVMSYLESGLRQGGRSTTLRMSWPARQLRKVVNLVKGVVHAP